jgi:ATP-dependent Lon protease
MIIYVTSEKSAANFIGTPNVREITQSIFAETNLTERLQKLCAAFLNIKKRMEIAQKIESRAYAQFEENIKEEEKTSEGGKTGQRDGMPRPEDERVADVKRFRKLVEGKKLSPLANKRFEEEVNRYLATSPHHSESPILRTYLEYLTSLPWGSTTEDSIDIDKAKTILDEGHYGMDDIKQRILEFLAVGKLQGKVQGKILCFVGPPGVEKTSIGESIAK